MKRPNSFLLLCTLFFIASCQSNDEPNAQNLKSAQQLSKPYDTEIAHILDPREPELEDALVRELYEKLKKEKGFIGLKVDAWHRCYFTANAFNCSFHGEHDPLFEDTTTGKTIRYGDLMFNPPVKKNDTIQPVNRSSTGTGTERNYSRQVSDILMISYGEDEIRLYFKAPKKLSAKFENGEFWRGPGVSTSVRRNVQLD